MVLLLSKHSVVHSPYWNTIQLSTSVPWNSEPAPFGNPSEILERKKNEKFFWGTEKIKRKKMKKKIWGQKKNFWRGGELVSFEKKIQKKFWKKFGKKFFLNFFCRFFQYYGPIFWPKSIFSGKITILSYKTIFGPTYSVISGKLVEQFFRKFQKHVILGQNGHFLARLAKIGQNEKFYQKSGRAIFYPYCPPTSCRVSEKLLERFLRSIRYEHQNIRTRVIS